MNTPALPSREEIDNELELAINCYDRRHKYPEWGNDSMREAYRAGFEDGALAALKPFREFIARFRGQSSDDLLDDLSRLVYGPEELS